MEPITDDKIYEYACCPTKFYLTKSKSGVNNYESLYLAHISELIEKNRERICKSLNPTKVSETEKSVFSETNKLMKKGENLIHGAVLCTKELFARPFLLEKVNKSSRLGKHSYQVIDFIPSIQFNEEYKKKLAFQSYLLYFYLGFMPNSCKMISIKQEVLEFNPVSIFEDIRNIINEIKRIDYTKEKPSPCINHHCKICRWKNKCLNDCLERKELSLLFGLTKETKEILASFKINTVDQVAKLDLKKMATLNNKGLRNIQFLIKQANSYITYKAELIDSPKLPKRYSALYFDIEGQIDLNFQYLFGIYNEEDFEYISFWADGISNERDAFLSMIKYLSKIKKYTLFHYGSYEKTAIKELCFKYNLSNKVEQNIINSMVDIYSIIKKCVAIPIPSYSLKDVAKFIGFKWRDNDALGVNSIIWHNNWLKTNDKQFKERLLIYNEDDCKATKFVKEWLEKTGDEKIGK